TQNIRQRTILRHKWQLPYKRKAPVLHTNQASCGASNPRKLELHGSFSGCKNSPEGRITNGKSGCCPRPRETLAAVPEAPAAPPSTTIAKKPTQQNPKTKAQAKPAKKNQIAARKTPKDPILPRERQSKQASKQPPKALSPSPSSP
ncbi:hypothetical protein PVAP13_5NG576050, partial [Panicum virgatum]